MSLAKESSLHFRRIGASQRSLEGRVGGGSVGVGARVRWVRLGLDSLGRVGWVE